jgi:hypothetical protein
VRAATLRALKKLSAMAPGLRTSGIVAVALFDPKPTKVISSSSDDELSSSSLSSIGEEEGEGVEADSELMRESVDVGCVGRADRTGVRFPADPGVPKAAGCRLVGMLRSPSADRPVNGESDRDRECVPSAQSTPAEPPSSAAPGPSFTPNTTFAMGAPGP